MVRRLLVLCGALHAGWGDIMLSGQWRENHCVGSPKPRSTVVAVATDSVNLLPILAVINSTMSNARDPGSVSTVVITRHVRRLHTAVLDFLPDADVTICGGFSDLLMQRPSLGKLMSLSNSTHVKRKELLSPFNFAAFYLPYVLLESRRVLYLDTDAIVEGDVGELAHLDLGGAPAAAVEDCTQKVFKYINYELLERYDSGGRSKLGPMNRNAPRLWSRFGFTADAYSNETCVFNRGVVLFDCPRWRELRLTETIEDLVDAFVASRAKLWRGGISQPPFLLALAGRYFKLDMEWNVRGLGRMDLGRNEWLLLAEYARSKYGAEPSTFERHMAPSGPFKHTFNPFLCPFSAHAKILHFNGELKPWVLTGAETLQWRHTGLNMSRTAGGREITGTCPLAACPTSVNVTTGRRLRSACETWSGDAAFTGSRQRWDQQHYDLHKAKWSTKSLETVTDYYVAACVARTPLCTCASDLSDDCVTSCASLWHVYVDESLHASPAAHSVPWANDSLAVTPKRRRLASWL
jgi:lipopolysaccharide biosynthesis glycosyltransferase